VLGYQPSEQELADVAAAREQMATRASMTTSVTRRRAGHIQDLTPPTRTEPGWMTPGTQGDWTTAPLIALDLEGSGAQDRDNEAILEIAVVPITAGHPDISAAYSTLINPGRTIPRRRGSHPD
jgi:hypothetical protein